MGDPAAENDVRVADAAAELMDVLIVAAFGVLEDVVLDPEAGAVGEAPDLAAVDRDEEGQLGERVDRDPVRRPALRRWWSGSWHLSGALAVQEQLAAQARGDLVVQLVDVDGCGCGSRLG